MAQPVPNGTACINASTVSYTHLGATVGDFFDKPIAEGGMNVSRPLASAVIAVVIIACILVFPQRAGEHPGDAKAA